MVNSTACLLLVEDEVLVADLVEAALSEAGFAVELAVSGQDAIAAIEARPSDFRGVVTDVNLGAAPDGWTVAKRAREIIEDLPVVYMTGDSGSEWASRGVPKSILITKPFAPIQVVTAIATLLNVGGAA